MVKVLEVSNLNYNEYKNINLSFEQAKFYSIIGGNNCGKTTLFRLLIGAIMTNDSVICNNIILNNDNINNYLQNIGIVERVTSKSFIYQQVRDEMQYPLYNLGYSKRKIENRIKKILDLFGCYDFLNKKITDLSLKEKQILLIMLSLLHKPKVLLLDNVLTLFSQEELLQLIKIFKELMVKERITIINFTSSLFDAIYSDSLVLLSHFKIIGEYLVKDIFDDDKLFYENGLEVPFIIDLSIKLKMYNVVSKNYLEMKEMVNDIWP